jgi:hypothetical protein
MSRRRAENDHDEVAPVDEREWALQEQALDEERRGMVPLGDARSLRYRLLARRLRTLPAPVLPSNFAWETARWVEQRAREEARAFLRFRRRLFVALALVYGACTLVALALSDVDALSLLRTVTPSLRWLLVLLACLVLPLFLRRLLAPRG